MYKKTKDFTLSNIKIESHLHNEDDNDNDCLNLKWKTVYHKDASNPDVFGSAFWFIFHIASSRYPLQASEITKERMKGVILGIPVLLPCQECSDHASAHIESVWHRINDIVSGREQLFTFFVDFHNYVNRRYGKPIMSPKEAYELYTSKVKITKLEYN